jgi:BRCA1-associated protein
MHSYSYHLKIELYPSPNPSSTESPALGGSKASKASKAESIWQPDAGSSIFDNLPSHARHDGQPASNAWKKREKQKSIDHLEDYLPLEDRRLLHRNPARVIDCGASRPTTATEDEEDDSSIVAASPDRRRERSRSFQQPGYQAGIGPRSAGRDWRFGPVRIESFDVPDASEVNGLTLAPPMMASSSNPSPAASLGPNLGGPGTDTKGEFVPLTGKNTEAGWGVVHLYREPHDIEVSSTASESLNGEDGTILCIPAVPGYLSPIAFLNFVGQKWMGQVAHYRMLMTSALGTYMVLMKFRDHKAAEAWRKGFDGKAFGPMRVSSPLRGQPSLGMQLIRGRRRGSVTSPSSSPSPSRLPHSPRPAPPRAPLSATSTRSSRSHHRRPT